LDAKPHDDPQPLTPSGFPADTPESIPGWFRRNLVNLITGVIALVVVFRFLNPVDVILAAAGLTLIIFIHELGHFFAAKLCKVRVETFSIGFGPALPYCSYKYGETTYKLAMVPLGGYVKMLGEGEGANEEDADNEPRSFKNQSVGERMFIISAGVIMNIFLGCVLFVIVYMHGLEEKPAVIARMEPGGAAWRAGIHSGSEIERIGTRERPWFDDIRPIIWATHAGEQLPLVIRYRGEITELSAEPLLDEGSPFPVLGILPPEQPMVVDRRRADAPPPYRVDSPASRATGTDGQGFRPGDRIVAMTDPEQSNQVTPLSDDPPGAIYDYHQRLARLAGQPVTVHVIRKGQPTDTSPVAITVPPASRKETGMRMRMGEIIATRRGSPAETSATPVQAGDQITEVEVTVTEGQQIRVWSADPKVLAAPGIPGREVRPLDPLRLPNELNRWADQTPGPKTVKLTVLRDVEHTRKPVTLELGWDELGRFDLTSVGGANTPLPINGLGLAYQVLAVVDHVQDGTPAAAAGVQPNDRIAAVRFRTKDHDGKITSMPWQDIKPNQWAFIDYLLQRVAPHELDVRLDRNGQTLEATLAAAEDPTAPIVDRGLDLADETRIMQAQGVLDALEMGAQRTIRSIQSIYMNLYAMAFGRVSFYQTVSGPITLARASYIIAGEDFWKLLLLLALISINLAVVNFLPIPVLDGGHMMFLIYEAIRGKPAPESVQNLLTIAGLVFILLLMLVVIGIDVWRLLRMWLF
jgi:regulator of sigma E protease